MTKTKKHFLIDMDGVLVQGKQIASGADFLVKNLCELKRKFLILTNNPIYTACYIFHRLGVAGYRRSIRDYQWHGYSADAEWCN